MKTIRQDSDLSSNSQEVHPQRNFSHTNNLLVFICKRYWSLLVAGIIFFFVASLLEGVGVGLLALLFQNMVSDVSSSDVKVGLPLVSDWINAVGNPNSQIQRVSFLIVVVSMVRLALMYGGSQFSLAVQVRACRYVQVLIFDQLAALQVGFFSSSRSGELINIATGDINSIRIAITAFTRIAERGLYILVYAIVLAMTSVKLALLSVSLVSLIPVLFTFMRKKIKDIGFQFTQVNHEVAATLVEFINGIWTIKAFGSEFFERGRLSKTVKAATIVEERQGTWVNISEPLSEFLGIATMITIIYSGFVFLGLPASLVLVFIYALLRFVVNLRAINTSLLQLSKVRGMVAAVERLLSAEGKPYIKSGDQEFHGLENGIRFEHVDFGYQAGMLVLNDINLQIEKGQTVALIGASGSGKSTLTSLLLRLYNPVDGNIFVDDHDILSYDTRSLLRRIAVVSQDTFLFNASVRDNISYGLDHVSEEDLIEAARVANALDFIQELPDQMDTLLGDRGVRLSGGQRQRIAIARAVLRDPDILIFDEATSALDTSSERIVQKAIDELSQDKTIIAIAHRLSTIVNADMIYVLDNGKIIGKGKYNDLIAKGLIDPASVV